MSNGKRVEVTAAEVRSFRRAWPCSGLPETSIIFEFDSRGDLVDIECDRDLYSVDGGALIALSDDAKNNLIGCKIVA